MSMHFCGDVSPSVVCGPGLTKQEFRERADINDIFERFSRTGMVEGVRDTALQFVDATAIPDFRESMNRVAAAREAFADLPAALRSRFGNDPAALVEFASDPLNYDEAVRLGLAVPKPVVELAPLAPVALAAPVLSTVK